MDNSTIAYNMDLNCHDENIIWHFNVCISVYFLIFPGVGNAVFGPVHYK